MLHGGWVGLRAARQHLRTSWGQCLGYGMSQCSFYTYHITHTQGDGKPIALHHTQGGGPDLLLIHHAASFAHHRQHTRRLAYDALIVSRVRPCTCHQGIYE